MTTTTTTIDPALHIPPEAYPHLLEALFKRVEGLEEDMREALFENSVLKKIVNGHLTPLRQSQLWSQTATTVQQSQQMYLFVRHMLKRGFESYTEEEREETHPWTQIALRGWTPLREWIRAHTDSEGEETTHVLPSIPEDLQNAVRLFFGNEWVTTEEQKRRGIPEGKRVIPPKLVVFYCPDASVPHDKLPLLYPLLALPLHDNVKVDAQGHTPLALKHARKGGDVITVLVPLPQMNTSIRNHDGRLFAASAEISGNDATLALFFRMISLYAKVQLALAPPSSTPPHEDDTSHGEEGTQRDADAPSASVPSTEANEAHAVRG